MFVSELVSGPIFRRHSQFLGLRMHCGTRAIDGKEFDQTMSSEEWDQNIVGPWEEFLHDAFRKLAL